MNASLDEKLKNVEWGKYKIGDLFEKIKVNNIINNISGNLPATTAILSNNQIGRYISRENATILKNVFSATANGFGKAFYQSKEFTVLQDSYAFKFIDDSIKIEKIHGFIVGALNKIYSQYDWGNKSGWEKIKKEEISLPTKNGKIDFNFMEVFIKELEKEKIEKLNHYLEVTGLKNCELTSEEEKVLRDFDNGKIGWGEFRIEDILDWQKQKEINPLKLEELKDQTEKKYPFYGQSTLNNGVISYIQLTEKVLNNKKSKATILIHSNNQNTVYLESPFYLKDGHGATSVLQSDNLKKKSAHFLISSIVKVISKKYDYNSKATKIELKNSIISVPIKNNKPDYEIMEILISAVQKMVMRDVVGYVKEKNKIIFS